MPATTYEYSILTDIAAGKVDVNRLASEIRQSSIVTALDQIDIAGDDLSIVFKDALSPADKQTLDGDQSPATPGSLIGAHSGVALLSSPPETAGGVPIVYIESPRTSDGKQIVLPNLFPGGVTLYFCGAGDSNTERGAGDLFAITSEVQEDKVLEFSFMDWVYMAGGGLIWSAAELGDFVSMDLYCPATPVTPNLTGTGNANLIDPGVGAAILIVPAPGNGAFDIDLATANLVPSDPDEDDAGTGFFTWDNPDTGKGVVTVGSPGASQYNLFAAPIPLARFVNKFPMLDNGRQDITVAAIKIKKILPHWKIKVTVHNSGHAGLKAAWYCTTARVKTL